jgi:hypothetical protein
MDYKKAYERLNINQKIAVDTIEGVVMVIAGSRNRKNTGTRSSYSKYLKKNRYSG